MPHLLSFPPASSTLPLSPSYRFSFYLPLLLSSVFPHCKICCVPEHLLIPLYVFLHIHSYSNFIHCYIFKYYFCVENFQICIFFLNLTYHIPHISISSLLDFHIQMLTKITKLMSTLENVSSKTPLKSLLPTLFSISINDHSFQLLRIARILIDSYDFLIFFSKFLCCSYCICFSNIVSM